MRLAVVPFLSATTVACAKLLLLVTMLDASLTVLLSTVDRSSMPGIIVEMDQTEAESKRQKCSLTDELYIIPELKEWSEGGGSCVDTCKAQASAREDVPTAPMSNKFVHASHRKEC